METTNDLKDTDSMRKECKKLLIDLGLDRPGAVPVLAREISTDSDTVNSKSLSMALTGYRNGERSRELLMLLRATLVSKYSEQLSGSC